jgi:hypothetical protein
VRLVVRVCCLLGALCLVPATGWAEWQFKPFAGVTFGGSRTFYDLDAVAGHVKANFGASAKWQGEIFGVEADVGHTPGYFSGEDRVVDGRVISRLILTSHVTTLTGNVVIALPHRIAQYTLRPYVVAGAGLLHVGSEDALQALPVSTGLAAMDLGAGVTGFLSDHVGVNWDVRIFRTLHSRPEVSGVSSGPEELSTWRATMGLVFRP